MSYSKNDLELAFNSKDETFDAFFDKFNGIKNQEQLEEEAKAIEEAKCYDFDEHNCSINKEFSNVDGLKKIIRTLIKDSNYDAARNMVDDYDAGLPDEGVDYVEIVKVNDIFYKVEVHCEAEWVGDWSVRKNLPGDFTITKLHEVTEYSLTKYGIKIEGTKII